MKKKLHRERILGMITAVFSFEILLKNEHFSKTLTSSSYTIYCTKKV